MTENTKTNEQFKQEIIDAAKVAIEELIKVLKEPIITNTEDDVSSDKLRNSVAAKKMSMLDAFEMISRIDQEQTNLKSGEINETSHGFAESKSK